MKRVWIVAPLLISGVCAHAADVLDLNTALQNTYIACVGIDDELAELKKMAGINTAVTAVGTAAGGAATVVGLVKANKDKQIANLEKELEKLQEVTSGKIISAPNRNEVLAGMDSYYQQNKDETKKLEDEIETLTKKSKALGNWRTGLIAGSAATNVAGAIIANKNKVDEDLQTQIDNCRKSVKELNNALLAAKMNGEDVSEAQSIYTACREYDYVDISPINKRAKGAMISSAVGTTTGVVGVITSAMANTDTTRNDNTEEGKQKEKNLNTAANVLSGATTVASGTATVFNATQISAIKKVAAVAEKCTGVLK